MLTSINEYDLFQIGDINSKDEFNEFAKSISRNIALKFTRNNCQIEYDLQELYIIKMYNRMFALSKKKINRDYKSFRDQFVRWVYMAIQDLGKPELADNYNFNSKITIQKIK